MKVTEDKIVIFVPFTAEDLHTGFLKKFNSDNSCFVFLDEETVRFSPNDDYDFTLHLNAEDESDAICLEFLSELDRNDMRRLGVFFGFRGKKLIISFLRDNMTLEELDNLMFGKGLVHGNESLETVLSLPGTDFRKW